MRLEHDMSVPIIYIAFDGNIRCIRGKEKARLVAQGFSQRPEDFDETYAPVAKMTSIHIILAFAAVNDLEIMASDIKTAFLHCCLCSDIYCCQISGQPPLPESSKVLHILIALYGLRQLAYKFYMLLVCSFQSLGLQHCEVNHVFYGTWANPLDPSIPSLSGNVPLFVIIPVYVDDSLIVCNLISLYL
jgi:Reverse transcriptase (RNA-dependent DNA polymerase)